MTALHRLFGRGLFIILAGLLLACSEGPRTSLAPPPTGGDFTLQSVNGPLDSRSLRGKLLLVYFGYANCPDVCPASLAAGAQALNALRPEEQDKVRLIMISVDPERDTPERLKDYVAFFHPAMIGLTGTAEEIAAVARAYGAGYQRQPTRPDGGYAVDHSADTYLIGPDGRLIQTLHFATPTEEILAAVRKHL